MRCAIYTRKSSAEGLEQKFNSLAAQREFCEAYVASQAGEGWAILPARYDDGGYSGGNVKRPGLTALLADVDAGMIDIVVVYKLDRLSRSLRDFVGLISRFEAHSVSFVAVTQSFTTTSSIGRLTLNVLLTFAQFERELTSERLRDKFSASKERGMWLHGRRPYGYQVRDQRLAVDKAEALVVRRAVRLCLRGWSIARIARLFAQEGIRNRNGSPIMMHNVERLLKNPLYLGRRKGIDGVRHQPIVSLKTFEAVQSVLRGRYTRGRRRARAKLQPPMLSGLLHDATGRKMLHVYKTVANVRRCYYRDGDYKRGRWPTISLRAPEMERAVIEAVDRFLATPPGTVRSVAETEKLLRQLVTRIDVDRNSASIRMANGVTIHCAVEGHTEPSRLAFLARHGLKRRYKNLAAKPE